VPDPHHPLSHHRNIPELMDKISKINTFHVSLFAYFLDKLQNTKDSDGSPLLDHMMIVYGSAICDGNSHSHKDLPVLVSGGGNGQLSGGRHITYQSGTPMTNLYLSLLDRAGAQVSCVGDSTGRLPYLSA
jgi:hypothetical protein